MTTRELKIKTGVVKRLFKELKSYDVEKDKQQARIDKLVHEHADEHDIRKQKEVLDETLQMIPDCKKRLEASYEELSSLMAKHKSDPQIESSEEYKQALQILEECKP
ncbi:putative cofactor A [Paraphysoderma sedebokerense]|nr:putative cofactor A [Paraphysoderma sedebokerense]